MLAKRGSHVAVTYRSDAAAAPAASWPLASWGVRASAYQLDLTVRRGGAPRSSTTWSAEYGGLHTLVYAAGPHVPMAPSNVAPADDGGPAAEDAAGFFNVVTRRCRTCATSEGSIVAVTTAATARFPVRDGLSAAPKAAVEALVRALAAEEGRYGVRVNAVGPGMLTDGMAARLISSGDLSDEALDDHPPQHPAAPLRHRHRHRRGGLLPRLRPGRVHLRPEAGRGRRLRGLTSERISAIG